MNTKDFSLLIQEFLSNNESITFDGIGKFSVIVTPASFFENEGQILPPTKEILFTQNLEEENDALAKFYSNISKKKIEYCRGELTLFFEKLKQELQNNKTYFIPDFGTLTLEGDKISYIKQEKETINPDNCLGAIKLEKTNPKLSLNKEASNSKQNSTINKWYKVLLIMLLVFIIFLLILFIFKDELKPFLEKILYTNEELDIIREWNNQ